MDADIIPSIPIESVWLVAVGFYIIIPFPDIIMRPTLGFCAPCLLSLKREYLSMSNVDTISVDSSIWAKYIQLYFQGQDPYLKLTSNL